MSGILLAATPRRADLVLSLSQNPSQGNSSNFNPCSPNNTTPTTTVSVTSGGSGTYTYSWEQIGTPATQGPYSISGATLATVFWSGVPCDGDAIQSETWRCTVTDTLWSKTGTIDATVTLTHTDLS